MVDCGDLDDNGIIDNQDVVLLDQYLAENLSIIYTLAADVNGDGRVGAVDLLLLRLYVPALLIN